MCELSSTYSANTRLTELSFPEAFIVALIRLRVAAQINPNAVPEDWRAGLRIAGVTLEGADAFDLLMHLFDTVLHMHLDVRSLNCSRLGQGEAFLLQAVGLLQHDHYDEAESIFARWLPPGVSRIATQQAQRFGRALAVAQLVVPLPMTGSSQLTLLQQASSQQAAPMQRDEAPQIKWASL